MRPRPAPETRHPVGRGRDPQPEPAEGDARITKASPATAVAPGVIKPMTSDAPLAIATAAAACVVLAGAVVFS